MSELKFFYEFGSLFIHQLLSLNVQINLEFSNLWKMSLSIDFYLKILIIGIYVHISGILLICSIVHPYF